MEGDYREYILHALFATKNSKHNGEKIIAELFEELNIDQDPDGGYIPCKFQQEKGDK